MSSGRPLTIERKIYLADTDATGFAYYARYLEWMESGRMDMLESTGIGLRELQQQGLNVVIRKVECAYRSPLRLGDTVKIECRITELGKASAEVGYRFINQSSSADAGTGSVSIVFIDAQTVRPTKIPEDIRKRLEVFVVAPE
jgi:tol-pal system-associated acyl-CoA thioesterase